MKKIIDVDKSAEVVSKTLQKTTEVSKKVASTIQKSAKDFSDKSKNDSRQRRLKKYNPLFPERYHSAEFNTPNMIVIVDDAVRRGIDVCEGAIGWLSNENGMEVLHLYDEAVEDSGIQFIPAPTCDTVYYVDRFNRNRFIQTDRIFSKAHEDRLAELKHIAYSLGAKSCSIEISESTTEVTQNRSKVNAKGTANIKGIKVSSQESVESSALYSGNSQRNGRIEAIFEGCDTPKVPELKWFAHDDTIKRLIDIRLENTNQIKCETFELEGSSSAAMSQKTAVAIDNAISKIGVSGNSDMENQATRESHTRLIYHIEF